MASTRSSRGVAGPLGTLYNLGAAGSLTDGQLLERFLTRGDRTASEAAFTALVDRHGPMVLSVCRRELGDPHDAHDAFQATFLVLMSKAATIRRRDSVGGWLFGIARRVAARARVDGARRRRHLEQFGAGRPILGDEAADASNLEPDLNYAPLLAEVARLPERFRAPVVLHYFEGLSAEATAQRLGCARGTVLSRLSRARDRIKRRLEQQGVSYTALIPAGGPMIRWLPPASVPAWLAQATVQAAGSLGPAGAAIESVVPAAVASLSRRVGRALVLSRVRMAGALFAVVAAGFSIGMAAAMKQDAKPRRGPAMERPRGETEKARSPRVASDARGEPVVVRGRVLDPDGKPAAGAEIFLQFSRYGPDEEVGARRVGSAGPDGRFEFTIPHPTAGPQPARYVAPPLDGVVAAAARGLGPDWTAIDFTRTGQAMTLKLGRDDVPIEGRIISLEGRPIPSLTVRVEFLNGGQMGGAHEAGSGSLYFPGKLGPIFPARTDSAGRFRMTGIGRNRGALLRVEGVSIERSVALVQTSADRDFKPIALQASYCGARRIEGPRFDLAVAPGRVIEGTVRDADTGQPIAGAHVNDRRGQIVRADAQGRFRFEGQPKAGDGELIVTVEDQPYVATRPKFRGEDGLLPLRVDVALRRGVWVEGRVINRSTGQPVSADVAYYALSDNPHIKSYPDAQFFERIVPHMPVFPTDADGRFRGAVPPGGGMLTVKADGGGFRAAAPLDPKVLAKVLDPIGFRYIATFHAFVPIDVPADRTAAIPDIVLDPGRTQHLRVTDAEGVPVARALVYCLQDGSSAPESLASDELIFHHDNPGKAETVIIVHQGRSLGGRVDLKGDEPDPMRMVLQPTGTVIGRLLDEDGKPRAGATLDVGYEIRYRGEEMHCDRRSPLTTGPDGRFRIQHLVPGVSYTIQGIQKSANLNAPSVIVKPGEVRDWGDVRVKAF